MTPDEAAFPERLAALRDAGALTDAEAARFRETHDDSALRALESLVERRRAGVVTAEEYTSARERLFANLAPPPPGAFLGREKGIRAIEPGATAASPIPVPAGTAAPAAPSLPPFPVVPIAPGQRPPPPKPPTWPSGHPDAYPMRFDVAYPERLSRLSTFFRGILVLPVMLFGYLVWAVLSNALVVGWTTVSFKKKYPAWLFQGASGAIAWNARFYAYTLFLTDKFPSFDQDESAVTLEYDPPAPGRLSRWRVFWWKLLLLIPHFVVLAGLGLATSVVVFLAWFAIMVTGRYPRGLFSFVTGVMRWHLRIAGYFASFNDRYPPYALAAEAGPAKRSTVVISGVIGFLAGGALTAGIVAAVVVASQPEERYVDYGLLTQGRGGDSFTFQPRAGALDFVTVNLVRVYDPASDRESAGVRTARGERVVVFEWRIQNELGTSELVALDDVRLTIREGAKTRSIDAEAVVINGEHAPENIPAGQSATVRAVFVLPTAAEPVSLRFHPGFTGLGGLKYIFK
jgi:hypothetical protein